jgi:hypothetical protein
MLHIIIFSKDRACQLDSLLRSIRDHFAVPIQRIDVLYRSSGDDFSRGYEQTISRKILPNISWTAETSFRQNLTDKVAELDDKDLVMFLVDDDVVFRRFDNAGVFAALSPRHLFISLRASRTYADDIPPQFLISDGWLEWKWNYHKDGPVTWNYPFSVDGNVFRAAVIKKVLRRIRFSAPNSFEGEMHRYRHAWWIKRTKLALAPLEAVVVNNPLNKVQTEGDTWHQDVSAESLNRTYLDGYHINNGSLCAQNPTAIHYPMKLEFERCASGATGGHA